MTRYRELIEALQSVEYATDALVRLASNEAAKHAINGVSWRLPMSPIVEMVDCLLQSKRKLEEALLEFEKRAA